MKTKRDIALGMASVMALVTVAPAFAEEEFIACGDDMVLEQEVSCEATNEEVLEFADLDSAEEELVECGEEMVLEDDVLTACEDEMVFEDDGTEADEDLLSIDDELFSDETVNGKPGSGSSELDLNKLALKESKIATQQVLVGLIDQMCRDCDYLTFLGAPLKAVLGELIGIGAEDPNRAVLEKLDELSAQIDASEEAIKRHVSNVVILDSIGGEFTAMSRAIKPLNNKINDIENLYTAGKITEEERIRRIGALYNSAEYNSLANAISGATNAYMGKTSNTLDLTSIFGAAYDKQCEAVMFSGEAIDAVTPYLLRQLAIYTHAYTLVNEVLDNYELTEGIGAVQSSRNDMEKNIEDVLNRYDDFFNGDRYIFVDYGKCSIKVNQNLLVKQPKNFGVDRNSGISNFTPSYMRENPLSSAQVKELTAYAAGNGETLFNFLFNDMKFTPHKYTGKEQADFRARGEVVFPYAYVTDGSGNYVLNACPSYVAAGAQNLTGPGGFEPSLVGMRLIDANKVGAQEEPKVMFNVNSKYGGQDVDVIFFQAR